MTDWHRGTKRPGWDQRRGAMHAQVCRGGLGSGWSLADSSSLLACPPALFVSRPPFSAESSPLINYMHRIPASGSFGKPKPRQLTSNSGLTDLGSQPGSAPSVSC